MGEPVYKIAKNKKTGEWWRVRVHGDGTTEPIEAIRAEPDEVATPVATDAPPPNATSGPAPAQPVPEAEAAPAPEPAPAPEEPGLWEQFLQTGSDAAQWADDTLSDALHSVTRTDLTDKLGAQVATALPVPGESERVYRDDPTETLQRQLQEDMRFRERRSPTLTGMGDVTQAMAPAVAGTMLAPIAAPAAGAMMGVSGAAALAPAATSTAGRMAAGALEAGAMGGAQRVGAADPSVHGVELLEEYLAGSKPTAAVGGAFPAVAKGFSSVARPVAGWLEDLGLGSRAVAPGGGLAEMRRLANREGLEYTDRELGREIERVMPPRLMPRSARDYAIESDQLLNKARERSGGAINKATELGVTAPFKNQPSRFEPDEVDVMSVIRASRDKAKRNPATLEDGTVDALNRQGRKLSKMYGGKERLTARELQDMKVKLEEAGYPSDPTGNLSDAATVRAAREASAGPRGALDDAMRKQAPEDVLDEWLGAKADIAPLEEVAAMSRGAAVNSGVRRAQEAAAFGGLGAMGGAMAGGDVGTLAGLGLGGLAWGGRELTRTYGKDALANVAGGTARALNQWAGGAQQNASALARNVVGASARDSAEPAASGFSGFASPAMAQEAPEEELPHEEELPQELPQTQREAGEHPFAARIRRALRSPRMLGDYGPELQQALEEGGGALGATLERLSKDPVFMREVMPVITPRDQRGGE